MDLQETNKNKATSPASKTSIAMQITSGPIPPPEILERYGQINTTFPERILAMAEIQSAHRREKELQELNQAEYSNRRNHREFMTGQISALIVTIMFIGVGSFLIYNGIHITGVIVSAIGPIGHLIAKFIVRKK